MASLAAKWRGFSQLTGFERAALAEACAGLVVTWPGLRLAGFRRWKTVLHWLSPGLPAAECSPQTAAQTAWIVARMEAAAARNLPFRTSCLDNSLVLSWLLMRRGIAAELRIGARHDGGKFEAHAWVECGGNVVNQPDEAHLHFAPFDGPIVSAKTSTN